VGELHALGGFATLAAGVALALSGAGAALLDRGHALVESASAIALAVFVVQGLVGILLLLNGLQPNEILHLAYGLTIAAVVPLAMAATRQQAPRLRSGVLGLAGVIVLFLVWRLFLTG
jgi:hypothetical protein